jgi:hypothetical protein
VTIKFHVQVETQGAVAVGSSAVLGARIPKPMSNHPRQKPPNDSTRRTCSRLTTGASCAPIKSDKIFRIKIRIIENSRRKKTIRKSQRCKSQSEQPVALLRQQNSW